MWRSHAAGGATVWLAVAPLAMPGPVALVLTPVAAFSALGPDIDHASAWISRRIPWVSWIVRWFTTHRQETHSALSGLLMFGVVLGATAGLSRDVWAALAVASAVASGWLTHILQDALTDRGVCLWWPWSARRFFLLPRRLRITTNGLSERLFTVMMIVAFVAYQIMRLRSG